MGNGQAWWAAQGGGQGNAAPAAGGGGAGVQPFTPPAPPAAKAVTTDLSLPTALQSLISAPAGGGPAINEQALRMQPTGTMATNPNYPVLDFRMQPTYAQGGMVGAGGMPEQPGMPPMMGMAQGTPGMALPGGQRMDNQQMTAEMQKIMRANPQGIQQIKQAIQQAIQAGQLDPNQLQLAVQLAAVAVQNPEMYPQLRQFAIQQGLATEQELSPNYDQGLVFILLLAGQAVQQEMGGTPMGAGAPPVQNFAMGGRVESFNEYVSPGMGASSGGFAIGSPSGDTTGKKDDIPIRVSGGEYVIPKHVVDMKGKEFFDSLLEKYNPDNAKA